MLSAPRSTYLRTRCRDAASPTRKPGAQDPPRKFELDTLKDRAISSILDDGPAMDIGFDLFACIQTNFQHGTLEDFRLQYRSFLRSDDHEREILNRFSIIFMRVCKMLKIRCILPLKRGFQCITCRRHINYEHRECGCPIAIFGFRDMMDMMSIEFALLTWPVDDIKTTCRFDFSVTSINAFGIVNMLKNLSLKAEIRPKSDMMTRYLIAEAPFKVLSDVEPLLETILQNILTGRLEFLLECVVVVCCVYVFQPIGKGNVVENREWKSMPETHFGNLPPPPLVKTQFKSGFSDLFKSGSDLLLVAN